MSVRDYLATFSDMVTAYSGPDVSLHVQGLLAWLVFDCASRPVNVVNIALLPQIEAVLDKVDELIKSKSLYFLILTSAKPHSFIAGADISAMYPATDQQTLTQGSRTLQSILSRIEALSIPTLAAINGAALGAGLEIALACDWRVCSDDRRVALGLPEVKLGLLPGSGGTVRLPEVVGLQEALGMILSGGSIKAARARSLGLLDAIIEEGDRVPSEHRFWSGVRTYATQKMGRGKRTASSRARPGGIKKRVLDGTWAGQWIVAEMAVRQLDQQTKGKYPAPYFALDSAVQSTRLSRKQSFDLEARYFGRLGVTPDSKHLMALFYLMEDAKRRKDKAGNAPVRPVNKVAVIGAGVMGAQIAALLASKRVAVYLRDLQQPIIDKALVHVNDIFAARVHKGKLKEAQATSMRALITAGIDLSGIADCDLVLEAAVERMDVKKTIIAQCEQHMRPDAIFATNTSSLSITELTAASRRPGNVLGIHLFNPVARMPLIEVIVHPACGTSTTASAYQFCLDIGKTPVLCHDGPGFIVNRILAIYMNEAGHLAKEGRGISEVDQAMLGFGMPMGPFRLMDEVGLDVVGHVGGVLQAGLGLRYEVVEGLADVLRRHGDMLGKKTGRGFYLYDEKGKRTSLNPILVEELAQLVNRSREQQTSIPHSSSPASPAIAHSPASSTAQAAASSAAATRPAPSIPILSSTSSSSSASAASSLIVDRCVLLMINEAAYILSSHVASCPSDVDLAMILGTGFPPFTGGLLSYADSRGLDEVVNRLVVLRKQYGERFKPAEELTRMAERGERSFPTRPDPRTLRRVEQLPRSRMMQSRL